MLQGDGGVFQQAFLMGAGWVSYQQGRLSEPLLPLLKKELKAFFTHLRQAHSKYFSEKRAQGHLEIGKGIADADGGLPAMPLRSPLAFELSTRPQAHLILKENPLTIGLS